VVANVAQGVIAGSVNRVVVGLGVTGLSCARYLRRRDLPFSVVDTRPDAPGLEEFRRAMPEVPVYAGDYPPGLVAAAAELVVSPGVAMDAPLVEQARAAGVSIVGDIDLFVREAAAPVVGITGSNAKSTVTELVGQMARDAGLNVGVGGNLGTPALDLLDPERALYVLELSSFQLERAGELGLAVATVLNITPDHLDRHGSMPRYHLAKHRIFRGCRKVVVNGDDPLTIPLLGPGVEVISWRLGKPQQQGFGVVEEAGEETLCHGLTPLLPSRELGLVGRHNVANALAALALGYAAGLPLAGMVATLRRFKGLPHRCQQVAKLGGVSYVNDSKGTNIGAAIAALEGMGAGRNILLIAGGQGKGADFSLLQPAVARHCKLVLLLGEDAPAMQAALEGHAPVTRVASMEEAVTIAAARAGAGDVVLLSPACASFDMFTGYANRGDVFSEAVARLQEARS
jgi:UDP-N-acetylmuramoylalanine--D-glutamate ligase